MIIAVIGPSSRGGVACELAKHLKFNLIDQDDIIPTLQPFLPSSSESQSTAFIDLFFKLVFQIASTQVMKLNLGLIVSTTLPQRSHIDTLKELVDSADSTLVIVHCSQAQDASDDYRFEGVQKFTVDPKHFVADRFLAEMSGKVMKRNSTHLHALSLYNNYKPLTGSGKYLHCKRCHEPISESYPVYQCIECDEYIFHKSCAEDPGDLELVRQNCPKNLRASKDPPELEKLKRCEICELNNKGLSVSCRDCLFETNLEAKILPLIINHGSHSHPLNLIMMPSSNEYKFGCCGCGELGSSISYRCYDCNYNLHVGCVLLERDASSNRHSHPLRLIYDSLEEPYWDKIICEVCNNEKNPEQWLYYCSTCEIVAHIGCCAIDQSN